jgi:type 1 glutamine amidotransferase
MNAPRRRQLIISGGWAHPFERTAPFLADVMDPAGLDSTVALDLDEAAGLLAAHSFDLLTVYACWFTMADARYDEVRSLWARSTSEALAAGIAAHVAAGRGVLALHTAPICFDDWPQWPHIVGGAWNWQRSWHPQPGELMVEPVGRHPIVDNLAPFEVVDERYTDLDVSPDAEVIAWTVDGDRQAAIWTHTAGTARVVYDCLGHDERSLGHREHAVVLRRCALWAMGASDEEVTAIR